MTTAFLLISYGILLSIILFMPKRITWQEGYITWGIVSLITIVSDIFLGQLLDKYDLLDKPGPQFIDVLIEISLPAAFGIVYMNFMPKGKGKVTLYLVFWVIFSVGYEHLSRYFGYVHYKGWKIWYSVVFYIFACLFMRWHYVFIRKAITKNRG
jgi:hypothetical protein